jgi:hypothetical protein
MNPIINKKNGKDSRKYALQNKYIGVRRVEFEDDTNGKKVKLCSKYSNVLGSSNVTFCVLGSSNEIDNLDAFQSTLYACSEKEGKYLQSVCKHINLEYLCIYILNQKSYIDMYSNF